ncbi:hypothetical protein V2J09_021635 [Rumex salicifolius]
MGNCICSSSSEGNKSQITLPTLPSSGISMPSNSTNRRYSESSSSGANSRFSLAASSSIDARDPNGEMLETPNLRIFSYAELKTATKGFKPDTVLGIGGFGKVYRGWVDDNKLGISFKNTSSSKTVVAVKKLSSDSMQGFEQWQSEVNFLGSISHPHLVRLFGYCWEDKELLLVYEYMPKGSLENHLFGRSVDLLSWSRRISIALGAARGLAYLHGLDRQVIYRDFKASNILLDGEYNAKLSDFGLAKFGPELEESHLTTRVMGTYGYAAPEYVATGRLYVKSDVYGFGVVLLELLTGLRSVDNNRPEGHKNLVEWLSPKLSYKKKLKSIMDPKFDGNYPPKATQEAAQLTLKCLRDDHRTRPSMKEVVEVLQQIESMVEVSNDTRTRSSARASVR